MESTLLTIQDDKNPFRLIEHRENEELRLPGSHPLTIIYGRGCHRVLFEGSEIGNVQIRLRNDQGGRYRYDVVAFLLDVVPERITEPVLARLRPYALYVQRTHEDALLREQAVMDNMLHHIGPVDGGKVKMRYEGRWEDVWSLLFPGMAHHVMGPQFRITRDPAASWNETRLICSYSEDGVTLPTFRLYSPDRQGNNEWQIWGRGNRERARYGFVSEMFRTAGRMMAETAQDPRLLGAARALIETLPRSAREIHQEATMREVRRTCYDSNIPYNNMVPFWAGDDEFGQAAVRADFGEGFTVLTRFPRRFETIMQVTHEGRPIMNDRTGFIPGIPREEKVLITQAAVMAASAVFPGFGQKHYQEALGRPMGADAHQGGPGVTERLLEEFGP